MIRRLAIACALYGSAFANLPAIAQTTSPLVRVQLDAMPTGALVVLLMRDVMGVPYVISPDVLADQRPTSVNLAMPRSELPQRVVQFLRGIGLSVTLNGGTVYVAKSGGATAIGIGGNLPSGSPLAQPQPAVPPASMTYGAATPVEPAEPSVFAVITPSHRAVGDLAQVLEAVLPNLVVGARSGSAAVGGRVEDVLEPDSLVIAGARSDIDTAVQLVGSLDRPVPTVEIRAVVFNVRSSTAHASALSVLASLGGLEIASSPAALPGEQFLRIATGGLRAVLSATRGDGRFRVVAEPSLSALSGTVATLNSGSQVPTLGSVSYSEDGTPLRSVVYRDSGVSLTVRPVVRAGGIDINVQQERSTFVRTETGVDESPTLERSSASSTITLRPGETIAIAGLDERSTGSTRSGFFGGLLGARSEDTSEGQLLLLIQADIAPLVQQIPPTVLIIDGEAETHVTEERTTDAA